MRWTTIKSSPSPPTYPPDDDDDDYYYQCPCLRSSVQQLNGKLCEGAETLQSTN